MEGGQWILETELVHSSINVFNKYLPSPMLGTGGTVVNTTHGLVFMEFTVYWGGRCVNQQIKQ